jgi:tetratricopeptide (TPR) repeat protein/SAM-dependent methyltransferase
MGSASAFLLQEAALLHRQGALAEAARRYQQVLHNEPANADALYHLAVLACQQGRLAEGIELARRTLLVDPRRARAHNLLGMALSSRGRAEEALTSFDQAIALHPDFADAHGNRATALSDLNRHDEALASYERAVALNPASAGDWFNYGSVLHRVGRHDEAIASYDRALALDRTFPQAHFCRGEALSRLESFAAAAASYRQALSLTPDLAPALSGLARVLVAQGEMGQAVPAIVRTLELAPSDEAKALFVACVKYRKFNSEPPGVRSLLLHALSEPWERPSDLAYAAASLVRLSPAVAACCERVAQAWPARLSAESLFGISGPAAILEDRLLRALLEAAPICDIGLERLLTAIRRVALDRALTNAASSVDENLLAFACALARQCFINEYIFDCTAEEVEQVARLRERLTAAIQSGAAVPPPWLVALAAYTPLHAIEGADKLLEETWPAPVMALLTQQVAEPRAEQSNRRAIARLTPIRDAVSLKVKGQYEQNPYPRWVKVAPAGKPMSVAEYFGAWYGTNRRSGDADTVDMLVAGCGTGQSLVETAGHLKGVRILAVDLSTASLGYAMRQARAAGLDNVTFAEADILELGTLGRTFDIIEAGGVLHHLADPWAGWRVLLSLLRPDGFMRVGLYSKLARRHINAARALVAARAYPPTTEGIRRSRQEILSLPDDAPAKDVALHSDFFATSECRDVLFHAQEHQMTLPEIADFIGSNGAEFLAFMLDEHILQQFKSSFPQDGALVDLALWHRFETDRPDTFAGMYQFWIRRTE